NRANVRKLALALRYSFAHEGEHRTETDPWEYAFGDPRRIESEPMFDEERQRVVRVLLDQTSGDWDADLLYHPAGEHSAVYHWSITEGMLTPYKRARLFS